MATQNLGRVVGYSAYEIAVQEGFVGTESEWLASLQGEDGATGPQGPQGEQGPAGPAGSYSAGNGISISNDTLSVSTDGPGLVFNNGGLKINKSSHLAYNGNGELDINTQWLYDFVNEIINPTTPTLVKLQIGENSTGDILSIMGASISGETVEGNYVYVITNETLTSALDSNPQYEFKYGLSNNQGGTQMGHFNWFSEGGSTGWLYNSQGSGPISKIIVFVDSSSSTSPSLIRVIVNPNWTPPSNES